MPLGSGEAPAILAYATRRHSARAAYHAQSRRADLNPDAAAFVFLEPRGEGVWRDADDFKSSIDPLLDKLDDPFTLCALCM
jgi:hypothetical protein